MLNRRGLLKGLAAFVAVASIPKECISAFAEEARSTLAIDIPHVAPGHYTFSCYVRRPGSNWIRIERSYETKGGPVRMDLMEMIDKAEKITEVGTSGPSPDITQVRFAQLTTDHRVKNVALKKETSDHRHHYGRDGEGI